MSSKEIEEILYKKCNTCNLAECIGCEMTYTERNKIKAYIEQLEKDRQKLIEKLEEDIKQFKEKNADGSLQDYVDNLLKIINREGGLSNEY